MGIIMGVLAVLMWASVTAMFLHRWLWQGADFWDLVEIFEPLKGIGLTLGAIVKSALLTAVICALIMGVAAGISYRKPTTKP
jgi:hypothetical protein